MKIGIIGFGNLGRSLAEGLVKSGNKDIYVCDALADKLELASAQYGFISTNDVNEVIKNSEVIFLTVKSYVFEKMNINRSLLAGKSVVSFMAGVQLSQLQERLGEITLVRGMPSLAISVCDGVIGYTKAPEDVEALFHQLGYAFETAPEDIDKVMAFSSCGLGFAAYLIDAFASAGRSMGFTPEVCTKIAGQTFKNAIERGDYKMTIKAVATPGGATEQGVLHMDASDVHGIVAAAVTKAYDRMK